MVTPDGAEWAPRPRVDNAMVKAVARAFRWRKMLDEGVHGTLEDLAGTLRSRRSAAREIESLTAQARLSATILGLLPIGFFLFLSVVAREKVLRARATSPGEDAVAAGRSLACRWVLSGAHQRVGRRLRVTSRLLDVATSDLRDARAAALNIVPAATGAARAVALVIPELQGKFGGMAFRVPTPTVSVIDFTAVLEKKADKDAINAAMQEASQGPLKGIMEYTEEPLVSTDLKGNTHSSIFSAMDTLMIGDDFCKVVSWYDNEWGYANRLADITAYVAERLG